MKNTLAKANKIFARVFITQMDDDCGGYPNGFLLKSSRQSTDFKTDLVKKR
jgi:hypothetical protein